MPIQQITTGIIADGAVVATDIADGTVTGPKLGANSVSSNNIIASVTLTTPTVSGNLSLDSTGTSGIRLPAANTLAFHTSGTEDMRITSAGDVGIGTANPGQRLEVLKAGGGAIRISETASRYVEINGYGEGSANGSVMAFNTITEGTSSLAERARFDNAGNFFVGGTTLNGSTGTIYSKTTAKVFVQWVGSNGTINQSKNVSSVTRNSTGDYTVNFSFTFSTNYAIVLGGSRNNGATDAFSMNYYSQTGSSIRVNTSLPAINFTDAYTADLVIFA